MKGSGGPPLLAALLLVGGLGGCAAGPQGLKGRLRKLDASLKGLARTVAAEMDRPAAATAGAGKLLALVPPEDSAAALRQGMELVRGELGRREGLGQAASLLGGELKGAGELMGPASMGWRLLSGEISRSRVVWPGLRTLLAREFSLRSTLDPRRRHVGGGDGAGIRPGPISPGAALIDPLPLW